MSWRGDVVLAALNLALESKQVGVVMKARCAIPVLKELLAECAEANEQLSRLRRLHTVTQDVDGNIEHTTRVVSEQDADAYEVPRALAELSREGERSADALRKGLEQFSQRLERRRLSISEQERAAGLLDALSRNRYALEPEPDGGPMSAWQIVAFVVAAVAALALAVMA